MLRQILKKTILCLLLVSICGYLSKTYAQSEGGGDSAGGFNGGGGDPLANDFLLQGRTVEALLTDRPVSGVDAKTFGSWLDRIQATLDGTAPQVVFPQGKTINCFGEPKVGCVSKSGKIRVARDGFGELGTADKLELVSLEIFNLMGVKDRYPKSRIVSDYFRIQSQTIEGHVQFMVQYQLVPASEMLRIWSGPNGTVGLSTCVAIGSFNQRAEILSELTHLLIGAGKTKRSFGKVTADLELSTRQLLHYCGVNGKASSESYLLNVARVKQAIQRVQDEMGLSQKPSIRPPDGSSGAKHTNPTTNLALKRTPKPGLNEGQIFALERDLTLDAGFPNTSWNYFVNGNRVSIVDLVKQENQSFCSINNTQGKMPAELVRNGVRKFPASANPYKLYEISWYVDTVFFESKLPNGNLMSFVVVCGTIRNGNMNEIQQTSLDAIQTHLKGILKLQP